MKVRPSVKKIARSAKSLSAREKSWSSVTTPKHKQRQVESCAFRHGPPDGGDREAGKESQARVPLRGNDPHQFERLIGGATVWRV